MYDCNIPAFFSLHSLRAFASFLSRASYSLCKSANCCSYDTTRSRYSPSSSASARDCTASTEASISAYLASFSSISFFINSEYSTYWAFAFANSSSNSKGLPSRACISFSSARLFLVMLSNTSIFSLLSLPVITFSVISSIALRNKACLTGIFSKPRSGQEYDILRCTSENSCPPD